MSDFLINPTPEGEERDDIQFERLVQKRKLAIQSFLENKDQARVETREIPLQLLALEWFNKIDASIETRAYLVENFLPILVLGCEKILKDAQKKNLVDENKKNTDFNPINLLGQFLMRNNPKYNNQNETSAYVRTMREVYHELREQMFAFQENKLAKVKADIRLRRTDRENSFKSRQMEIKRRCDRLEELFGKWHISTEGRIEIAVIDAAFNLYNDHIAKMPDKTKKASEVNMKALPSYCFTRDGLNMTKRLLQKEFVQSVIAVTDNLSSEFFDLFIEFMGEVTEYFVVLANRTRLNKILKPLFNLIDSTGTGLLIRKRLMKLLEEFSKVSPDINDQFRSAIEWPLLDPYIKFENIFASKVKVIESEEQEPDQLDEVETVNPDENENKPTEVAQDDENKPVETVEASENLPDVSELKNEEEEASKEEPNPESPEQENNEDPEKSGEDADKVAADKTEETAEVKKPDPVTVEDEEEDEDTYVQIKTVISKENELLFLNGGILYYKPLEDSLHAFDTSLIQEQKNPRVASARTVKDASQLEFNSSLLNSKQFLNILETYVRPEVLSSEKNINDLIVFLKDNYSENHLEKNAKLEKAAFEKQYYQQRERIGNCFEKLDNEGSRTLSFEFLADCLENFKEGMFKEQVEKATETLRIKIGNENDIIYKEEFIDYISNLIKIVDFAKFEDQIMNYLNGLVMPNNQVKARGETRKTWLGQIEQVGDLTFGNFEPLYKQLFATLIKDSETHANNKTVSAYVGILETRGKKIGLKYHASTPYDSNFILGKTLYREDKNVTFDVIDGGKPVNIERVSENPNVHYFNPDNEKNGALLIYPLKYSRNKTFGAIGFDSLQDKSREQKFYETDISFYQGVANTFARSYANIVFKNRMAKAIASAISWLNERSQAIDECNVYVVQTLSNATKLVPEEKSSSDLSEMKNNSSINLKPIMKYAFSKNGLIDQMTDSVVQNNFKKHFKSNLHECAITSETTVDLFNSNISVTFPLRNEYNKAAFVVEFVTRNMPEASKKFSAEIDLLETVIYVLDACQRELFAESILDTNRQQYSFENDFEHEKSEILFEKVYLRIINDRLAKLSDQQLTELLPDGSESPETSKTKNLFKLVSDLIKNSDLVSNECITEGTIQKIRNYDATIDGFQFNKSQSIFDLSNSSASKELHSFYNELGKVNANIRLLIDWVCLQHDMKQKVDQTKERLNKD